MIKFAQLSDIENLFYKSVFLTVDYNISLKNGTITNDTRIIESIPTIKHLLKNKAKIILASHLGRPAGIDMKYTLQPVADRLERIINRKIHLISNFWQKEALDRIQNIDKEELVLLENIRFHQGEEKNDKAFAKHLAKMADYFVNDAFGASHRVHASIVGIAEYLPSFAGLLLAKEIKVLADCIENPKRPFVVIIGGAKTPEKIAVIEKILDIADTVLLGGAIANTFLAAWGFGMGKSLVDYEMIEMARVVFWKATKKHSALLLPLDVVTIDESNSRVEIVDYNQVPHDVAIYDIGPKTYKHYREFINNAKSIIWNGPMGMYENPIFSKGTNAILTYIAQSDAFSIIGGGDTLSSLLTKKYLKQINHISTGGSAMLEFIEKGSLPGIEVLKGYSK